MRIPCMTVVADRMLHITRGDLLWEKFDPWSADPLAAKVVRVRLYRLGKHLMSEIP